MSRAADIEPVLLLAAPVASEQFDYVRFESHVQLDGDDFNTAYSVHQLNCCKNIQ